MAAQEQNAGKVEVTIATFTRGADTNLFIDTAREQGTPLEIIPEEGLCDRAGDHTPQAISFTAPARCPANARSEVALSNTLRRICIAKRRGWRFTMATIWPTWKARAYNQLDRWSLRAAQRVLIGQRSFLDESIHFGVAADNIGVDP